MKKAACRMGDAWMMARAFFHATHSDEEKFQLARVSAEKGDVDGTCCLVLCFPEGIGCEKNENLAEELLERALDLAS